MTQPKETWAALTLVPIGLTGLYYVLPVAFQQLLLVQFLPQISGYLCLGLWAHRNTDIVKRLGLDPQGQSLGVRWGATVGLVLGILNTIVILWVVPLIGNDISFLRETPHAKVSTWIMIPWFIMAIAIFVELNFRGFLLGRLHGMFNQGMDVPGFGSEKAGFAIVISAIVFSFDPFMVATFRHLHWIAVWDGVIWGAMWIWMRNLYAVILAHAIEVVILYLCVKNALT